MDRRALTAAGGRRLRIAEAAFLAACVAVLLFAPQARASGPCGSAPCYTAFTVNGGAPPAGLSLMVNSAGGMVQMELVDTSGGLPNFDLSGLVSGSDTIHVVLDLGTYVPHFMDATGLVASYSVDTTDPSHTLVTLDAQPRPSSWTFGTCVPGNCAPTATADYGEMFLAAFSDLSGAPDPSLVSEIDGSWVSTNAQAIALPPTFDAATGAFSFQIAAPHYEKDGTTLNQGFFRAFLPDSVVEAMGIANPSTVSPGSFLVSNSAGGTVTVTVSHQADPAGVVIDAPLGSFHYSSPTFTIKKAVSGGGATLDHFAVTAVGGAPVGAQTAGHAFSVTVTAKTAAGTTLTSFSGSVTLASNATCSAGCSTLVTLSHGVGTRSIAVTKARTGAAVTAIQHGGTKHGTSSLFTVRPAAAHKLVFTGTSTAKLTAGRSRTLVVTVEDAYGNKVTAGAHTIHLAKVRGAGTVAGLPADVATRSGVATKSVTGKRAGQLTIRAASGRLIVAAVTFTVAPRT